MQMLCQHFVWQCGSPKAAEALQSVVCAVLQPPCNAKFVEAFSMAGTCLDIAFFSFYACQLLPTFLPLACPMWGWHMSHKSCSRFSDFKKHALLPMSSLT